MPGTYLLIYSLARLLTYLLSGEWLSYLKYFGVDAKSRNVSFINDEIIKKIQGLRDAQQLAVIDDVYSTGIDIFKPNSREICSEKLELLLFWNKVHHSLTHSFTHSFIHLLTHSHRSCCFSSNVKCWIPSTKWRWRSM